MPPNEPAGAVFATAQTFDYDRGPSGPASQRAIAVETPIQLSFGGAPFAVMMATPRDLRDFAVGFALTEGIVERIEDIRGVAVSKGALDVLMEASWVRMRATSCPMCGAGPMSRRGMSMIR